MENNLINGPANVVRLEGEINGVHKVLYTFMDWHVDVQWQTRCSNFLADTMPQYIFKTLNKNKDTTYDFFMEMRPNNITYPIEWMQHKYIGEMELFFQQMFKYDNEKDKVMTSDEYPNLRVHYADVRDSLEVGIIHEGYAPFDYLKYLANDCYNSKHASEYALGQITTGLDSAMDKFNVIKNKLHSKKFGGSKIFEKVAKHETDIITDEVINKIKNVYKNDNVMTIMNELLNDIVELECDKIDESIRRYRKFLKEGIELARSYDVSVIDIFGDKMIVYGGGSDVYYATKLYIHTDNLYDMITRFFAWITDIYFLRRFLDKSYITNAFTYHGALHSQHFVYVLVKYFNFKVTHICKSQIEDVDKLNKFIKKTKIFDEEFEIKFHPKQLIQCVDMSNFPKNLM